MAGKEWHKIKETYREVAKSFECIKRQLGDNAFYGFKVLNSPPIFRPECFFVGFQPSGDHSARRQEERYEYEWPKGVQYVECVGQPGWKLADRMVESFGVDFLNKCMGSNAIFMRYPDVKSYKKNIPAVTREKIRNLSAFHLQRIIEIVEPKSIVTIGFDVLKLFEKPLIDHKSPSGRVLTKRGSVFGAPATAMMHLTGCRISTADRISIAKQIKSKIITGQATIPDVSFEIASKV
jgi:hypothetical protein